MNDLNHPTSLAPADYEHWSHALAAQPTTREQLTAWIEGPLRTFMPFKRVFCAHGELVAGQIKLTHWLAVGHTDLYLEQMAKTFELQQRSSLAWWLANRQPFYIDPANPAQHVSPFELEEIRLFDLENIVAHGISNHRANAGTYFSFAGVKGPLSQWHLDAMKLIAPVLNDRFLALVASNQSATPSLSALTPRQLAIVRGVVSGHDDKTIARLLGITEKTVRNQLTETYGRLGIRKRTQLIALVR